MEHNQWKYSFCNLALIADLLDVSSPYANKYREQIDLKSEISLPSGHSGQLLLIEMKKGTYGQAGMSCLYTD
jgi:hypothetical protein